MLSQIISNIEDQKISISEWVCGFLGIVFVRFFLEFFSNPSPYGGSITSDSSTLVHYGLFFLTTVLGLVVVLYFFSGKRKSVMSLGLFGLPVIWLSPIIDIISSRGNGFVMTYILDSGSLLFMDFLTYFGPHMERGATLGIRIEIFVILCSIGAYVWNTRRKIVPTLLSILFSYTLIFMLFALPGVFYTVSDIFGNTHVSFSHFIEQSVTSSNIRHSLQDGMVAYTSRAVFLEFAVNKLFSQIFFVLGLFFLSIFFRLTEKEKLKIILKNSRPERVFFYLTLLCTGALSAYVGGFGALHSWVDILSSLVLLTSWSAGWLFAVHTNDIIDIDIDKISNTQRPLSSDVLSLETMKQTAYIWLIISLVGSFIVGYYPFFMNCIFLATYYIYSCPPLRLKRVPLLSSFLIGLACLSTLVSGFFFVSSVVDFHIFSPLLALGLVLVFTLGVNIRDMKDIDGDHAMGIKTVPVICGVHGARVVGVFFALSFLLLPIVLSFYTLFILSIPSAFFAYKIATKKPYSERYVFVLYFSFVFLSGLLCSVLLLLR